MGECLKWCVLWRLLVVKNWSHLLCDWVESSVVFASMRSMYSSLLFRYSRKREERSVRICWRGFGSGMLCFVIIRSCWAYDELRIPWVGVLSWQTR